MSVRIDNMTGLAPHSVVESVTIAVGHDRLPNDLPVEQSHG